MACGRIKQEQKVCLYINVSLEFFFFNNCPACLGLFEDFQADVVYI